MKPISLEVTLDLTHPSMAGVGADRVAARVLRLLADRIEEDGICPGGVWGGVITPPLGYQDRIGYWVVRAEASCRHCGGPIRQHPADPLVWMHNGADLFYAGRQVDHDAEP